MGEIKRPLETVLSEEQIHTLYEKLCVLYEKYFINDEKIFFDGYFIDGYALISYGESLRYGEIDGVSPVDNTFWFDEDDSMSSDGYLCNNIVDTNGNFVTIFLDKDIKYSNGKIINLKDDGTRYEFVISRVKENKYQNEKYGETKDTSYFVIKILSRTPKCEVVKLLWYVIDPKLNVIAKFSDIVSPNIEYGSCEDGDLYTDREFYFMDQEREYIIFSQTLCVNTYEPQDEYPYDEYSFPDYDVIEAEFRQQLDEDYYDCASHPYDEEGLSEDEIQKAIAKDNGEIDESNDEYYEIPDLCEINFFFDDASNILYKDAFEEYYRTTYGIIDCKIKSDKQLLPFADNLAKVRVIISSRNEQNKEYQKFPWYRQGWDFGNNNFYGYILNGRFFDYPSSVKGFTLKYVYDYYPYHLKWLCENKFILIPNNLLNTLENSELTRFIRINQEIHLSYSKILKESDCINSSEYKGVVSSYQGKSISQIINSKGGTKHLVHLLKSSNLIINRKVLEGLFNIAENDVERKCYDILISVIDELEYLKEQERDWIQGQMEADYVRDANEQFYDLMDDFGAWNNID